MIGLEGAPRRQAALMLYAMAPADRDWILASLEPDHAQELVGLMDELRSLEVVPDRAWLVPLAGQHPPADPLPSTAAVDGVSPKIDPAASPTFRWEQLDADQIRALAGLLNAEPVQVTVWLLSVMAWSWRDSLMRSLSGELQMRVRQELRAGALGGSDGGGNAMDSTSPAADGAAIQRAVLIALGRRLQSSSSPEPLPLRPERAPDSAATIASRLLRPLRDAFQGSPRV